MLRRLADIDRRWIYLLVLLSVIFPLAFPLNLPVSPSEPVRKVHDYVSDLPSGSLVWLGFDYWATTRAECDPSAEAVARQLFQKGCRIVTTSTIPDGALISQKILGRLARENGKKYGVDYAVLGYKAGSQLAIKQICENVKVAFPTDVLGTKLDDMPLTRAFRNFRDVDMIFSISDNKTLDYYAIVAHTQFGLPVAGAATAVMVPELMPYVNSGQLIGVLGGLRGAAEYEKLTGYPGLGTRGMDVQSIVHLLIVTLIIVSNVGYFASRRRR